MIAPLKSLGLKHVVTAILLFCIASSARADFISATFGVPTADQGSWAYSKSAGVGHGNSTIYQPLIADWSAAVFQGYVHEADGPNGWDTVGAGTHDEDTIYVFKTFFLSQLDLIIPTHFNGDDGHSLYINGNLIAGAGFGVQFDFNLVLTANTPLMIEIGNYNGLGAMAVSFHRQDSNFGFGAEPGVMINAVGNFSAVPEPETIRLTGLGIVGLICSVVRRRRLRKRQ